MPNKCFKSYVVLKTIPLQVLMDDDQAPPVGEYPVERTALISTNLLYIPGNTSVKFLNKTDRYIHIYIDDCRSPPTKVVVDPGKVWATCSPRKFFCICEDKNVGDKLTFVAKFVIFSPDLVNGSAQLMNHMQGIVDVVVTSPVYSLQERCLQVIRDSIKLAGDTNCDSKHIETLCLPELLQRDLMSKLSFEAETPSSVLNRRGFQMTLSGYFEH